MNVNSLSNQSSLSSLNLDFTVNLKMEDTLLDQLKPIFPNLTEEVILISIRHPSNNTDPLSPQSVFMSCIDDLLQLRTFSLASAEPQKKQTLSSDGKSMNNLSDIHYFFFYNLILGELQGS